MIKIIICDWNRTLFMDRFEDKFFEGLYRNAIFNAIKQFNFSKVFNLLFAENKCKRFLRYSEKGLEISARVKEVINVLNENVIKGISVTFLKKYTENYAIKAAKRLDIKLLDILRDLQRKSDVRIGIISSGYKYGIEKILSSKDYKFEYILANDFDTIRDRVIKFNLAILDNKREVLNKLLSDLKIEPENVVYIGDSWQDEECFGQVGYPIISLITKNEYGKKFLSKFNVFVPKGEIDLHNYLLSHLA